MDADHRRMGIRKPEEEEVTFDVMNAGGGLNSSTIESVELSRSEIPLNRDAEAFGALTYMI